MQLRVTGRHVEIPPEVREYVNTKVAKLSKYYDRIHEVEVILGHEKEQFSVEMIVHTDQRHTFVAKEVGPDTFALVDEGIEKLGRQLTKHKEKIRNRKGNTPADGLGAEPGR